MMNTLCRYALGALVAAAFGLSPGTAEAVLVNYGDFMADTVTFEDVRENSDPEPDPLFVESGSTPMTAGDSLVLDPDFRLDVDGPGSDVLDGELSFMITAKDGYSISSFTFQEAGSVTLAGGRIGGIAAAEVAATVLITSAVVDGELVDLVGEFVPFTATNGGVFELPDYSGTNTWVGSAFFDVNSLFDGEVTKLTVVIDNTLLAEADELSSAFIDKKEISITVDTGDPGDPEVPEPTALGLLAIGIAAVLSGSRNRG